MTDLRDSIVAILGSNGSIVGTGFLASAQLALTCAHVIEAAGGGSGCTVQVRFHSASDLRQATVLAEYWRAPQSDDVAVLRFECGMPEEIKIAKLGSNGGIRNHSCITFGYPSVGAIDGLHGHGTVYGRVTEASGRELLQVSSKEITPGFSGAPVFDLATRRVIGMVTEVANPDRYGRLGEVAFLSPSETLQIICPELRVEDICPYRGLSAFTEDDVEFFFGRTALVAELCDHLRLNPRFLAVVGSSGSGKSSAVQAGLIPRLRHGDILGFQGTRIVSFRPSDSPIEALRAALNTNGIAVAEKDDVWQSLQGVLEDSLLHPVVLFVDQFEELFAHCQEPARSEFIQGLAGLLHSASPITLIMTVRADFYDPLLRSQLGEFLDIGQINVRPITQFDLREAASQPAEQVGLEIETGLDDLIIKDLASTEHPLPLLEFALYQLWVQRQDGCLTHEGYRRIGGTTGAVGRWATEAYTCLSAEDKEIARRIFTRLINYGEGDTPHTRFRLPLTELFTVGESPDSVHEVIRQLANAHLLVTGRDPHIGEVVEIVHDTLLREWPQLVYWIREQRAFLLWRQRLDERIREWRNNKHESNLLHGAPLNVARGWLAECANDLNPDEKAFVQDSIVFHDKKQRQRMLVAVAAISMFLSLAILAGIGWWSAETQRQEADVQRRVAVARQLLAQARTVLDNTRSGLVKSTLLVAESVHLYPTLEGDQALRQAFRLLSRPVVRAQHQASVWAVAYSPDGRWLASGSGDKTLRVWDTATGSEVVRMQHGGWVQSIAFSPDGRLIASGSGDGIARVWKSATGEEVARMTHAGPVWSVKFSPNGRLVASGGGDGIVRVWDAVGGHQLAQMKHDAGVRSVDFSSGGQWLVSGSEDSSVRVWATATGREQRRMMHEGWVWTVAFGPNEHWVASGSSDNTLRIWDVVTGDELARVQHGGWVQSIAFNPDGQLIASAGASDVRVWDMTTWKALAVMRHEDRVLGLAFSPDGQMLVSGSEDETLRVWGAATGRELARIVCNGHVNAVAISPDGKSVAGGGDLGTVGVWSATAGDEIARLTHKGLVASLAVSANGQWLASGSWDGSVQLWNPFETGTATIVKIPMSARVNAVALSPDGQLLASGIGDPGSNLGAGEAQVWRVNTRQLVARVLHAGWVRAVAFSPDGKWVASGSNDGTLRIWEAATGREIAQMKHRDAVTAIAFDPSGQWLVSASDDHTAKLWDVMTGNLLAQVKHEDWVRTVIFSPDGHLIASGSGGWLGRSEIRIWEAPHGREIAHLMHQGAVVALRFSQDSQSLVSGSLDGTARLWKVATGREVAEVVHKGGVTAVTFGPDDHWIASGSTDGILRVWEAANGKVVNEIRQDTGSLWAVVFSPNGQWLAAASGDPQNQSDGDIRIWLWRPGDMVDEACRRLPRNLTSQEWQQYLPEDPYRALCPDLPVPEN